MATPSSAATSKPHPLEVGSGQEWDDNPTFGFKESDDPRADAVWDPLPSASNNGEANNEEALRFRQVVLNALAIANE
jgi:hypothetical protein